MSYEIKREELPHNKTVFTLQWNNGRGGEFPNTAVTRSGDGCITIHMKNGYLYSGETELLSNILKTIVSEEKSRKRKNRRRFLSNPTHDKTANKEIRKQTKLAKGREYRWYAKSKELSQYLQVKINNEWKYVGRETFMDKVCVYEQNHNNVASDESLKKYKSGKVLFMSPTKIFGGMTDG